MSLRGAMRPFDRAQDRLRNPVDPHYAVASIAKQTRGSPGLPRPRIALRWSGAPPGGLAMTTVLFSLASSAFLALVFPGSADAQHYPNRPGRLLVGYPPGGPADVTARLVAPYL